MEIMSLLAKMGFADPSVADAMTRHGENQRTSMSVDATNLYSRNKLWNVVGTYWVNIWVSKFICVSWSRSTAAKNVPAVTVLRIIDFTTIRTATKTTIFGIFLIKISPPSRSSGCSITAALLILQSEKKREASNACMKERWNKSCLSAQHKRNFHALDIVIENYFLFCCTSSFLLEHVVGESIPAMFSLSQHFLLTTFIHKSWQG